MTACARRRKPAVRIRSSVSCPALRVHPGQAGRAGGSSYRRLWQKIAISRGFYARDALHLILDEPTAAIDARPSMSSSMQRMKTLAEGKTTFDTHRFRRSNADSIISHRPWQVGRAGHTQGIDRLGRCTPTSTKLARRRASRRTRPKRTGWWRPKAVAPAGAGEPASRHPARSYSARHNLAGTRNSRILFLAPLCVTPNLDTHPYPCYYPRQLAIVDSQHL